MSERKSYFNLYVEKRIVDGKLSKDLRVKKQGMSVPEVLIFVEAWLEEAKEKFKGAIIDGFLK